MGSAGAKTRSKGNITEILLTKRNATDAQLDAAATLLRLLYIRDLRALQAQVDGAVVAVQELTANPCTDARLGRVGR